MHSIKLYLLEKNVDGEKKLCLKKLLFLNSLIIYLYTVIGVTVFFFSGQNCCPVAIERFRAILIFLKSIQFYLDSFLEVLKYTISYLFITFLLDIQFTNLLLFFFLFKKKGCVLF